MRSPLYTNATDADDEVVYRRSGGASLKGDVIVPKSVSLDGIPGLSTLAIRRLPASSLFFLSLRPLAKTIRHQIQMRSHNNRILDKFLHTVH